MQAKLDEWGESIDKLKLEAKEASAETRANYQKTIDNLQEKQRNAREKMHALRESSGGAWQDVKGGFEQAWHDLGEAFKQARDKF
jgi:hypothetical protein